MDVRIASSDIEKAATEGLDEFVTLFVKAIKDAIGGELTSENIGELNADQVTLLGYSILHEEVMDGGFIQLIHNGYGPFFFRNPFARAIGEWGLADLKRLIRKAHDLYRKYGEDIEHDCTDEEFMQMFEHYPAFDDLDDSFVENEELWTSQVAYYIDENINNFATVI